MSKREDNIARIYPTDASLSDLPDGAVIVSGGVEYTVAAGYAFRVGAQDEVPRKDICPEGLLTPPSRLDDLRAGRCPPLDQTIRDFLIGTA